MSRGSREPYPPFQSGLVSGAPGTWTPEGARAHFAWQVGQVTPRTTALLRRFLLFAAASPESVLTQAGTRAAELLRTEPFSEPVSDASSELPSELPSKPGSEPAEGRILTREGMSLAADLGLLVARLLIARHPQLTWHLEQRPGDLDFNLAVLTGFPGGLTIEPVGGSIAEATEVLLGRETPDIWWKIYEEWDERAAEGS